jgi:hypothetical protein
VAHRARLFGDVQPIGEQRDLLRQPVLIDVDAAGKLPYRQPQPLALLEHALRCALGDAIQRPFDDVQPLVEIGGESEPLVATHLEERIHGAVDDREQRRAGLGRKLLPRRAGEHVVHSQHRTDVESAIEVVPFLKRAKL